MLLDVNLPSMARVDPGEGFAIERLLHAAISNPVHDPLQHTNQVSRLIDSVA